MSTEQLSASATATAAFQAAGFASSTLQGYRRGWSHWETWCREQCVDPLDAVHHDYERYLADHPTLGKSRRRRASGALRCVYMHIGKLAPTMPVPQPTDTVGFRSHEIWFGRYKTWCEQHDKEPIPAEPSDVIAFLEQMAQFHRRTVIREIRSAISWHHKHHGYPPIASHPEVAAFIKALYEQNPHLIAPRRDKPLSAGSIKAYEIHRARWRKWCHDQNIDPLHATPGDVCQYIEHLAASLLHRTIAEHLRSISAMYQNDPPTQADVVKKAFMAIKQGSVPRQQHADTARQETDAEIARLVNSACVDLEAVPEGLTDEQITRVKRVSIAADLTERTLRQYVSSGWLPYKRWCESIGISVERATAAHVAAYLTELAEQNPSSPTKPVSALAAISYCYEKIRPLDNPADHKIVHAVLQGIKRGNPLANSPMDPITKFEFQCIRATALDPDPWETEPQALFRGITDIALVGTMRDAMLRSDEAAKVLWSHIEEQPDGSGALHVPRSKTDQASQGAYVYLSPQTMDDLRAMRKMAYDMALPTGPEDRVFLMTKFTIYKHIIRACARAGLHGRYGGHSPRIGMAHDLIAGNVNKALAMQAGRWGTESMLVRYTRKLDVLRGGVAQWYARDNSQDSPDPEPDLEPDFNPLAEFGLFPS